MRILVLDILLSQANERKIPPDVLPRLYREYARLAILEKQGNNSVADYLSRSKDGIPFEGIQKLKKIYKFRLSDGDRILYTYGDPQYRHDMMTSDIILLGYAKHDKQEFFARNTNFFNRDGLTVTPVKQLADDMNISEGNDCLIDSDGDFFQKEYVDFLTGYWSNNYVNDHNYDSINDEDFANLPPERWDKLMTDEQRDIIDAFLSKPVPTLVLGGAGTGKTIMGVHLMSRFQHDNKVQKGIYITQSYELRKRVEELYSGISHEEICCININDYCIDKLGKRMSDFVETQQFVSDFWEKNADVQNRCNKMQINPMEVWTEIRGVIKGSMGQFWTRTQPQHQNDYSYDIGSLVDLGYLKRCKEDNRTFVLADDIYVIKKKAGSDTNLDANDKIALKKVIDYFSKFDIEKISLSKEEYLNLPEERSTTETEKRKIIWWVFELYENFLSENDLFDDNDLVRMTFNSITDEDKYDLIFTDEVQDFTELQLFFINKLCKNSQFIFFAGDSNQNVNPALFDEDRLKALYCDDKRNTYLITKHLIKNHRCTKEVVHLANTLSELRRTTIGRKNQYSEENAYSSRPGNKIWRIAHANDNISLLVKELSRYPGTAVLVPNETVKKELAITLNEKGVKSNFIFTVSEIKGMEYQYVLCYNLFSAYSSIWNNMIVNNIEYKHKTKYRYYFNLIYVAVTRSKLNLCFSDDCNLDDIDRILNIPLLSTYNQEDLSFSALQCDEAEWYKMAQEYERNGNYETAIENYQNAGDWADLKDVLRCRAEILVNNRDFERAVKYAVAAGEIKRATELINQLDSDSPIAYVVSIINSASIITTSNVKKFGRIKKIIHAEFSDIEGVDIDKIEKILYESMYKSLSSDICALENKLNRR